MLATSANFSPSDSQRHDFYKWLQTTNPSPIHHQACTQYEPKTGDWMLRSPEWNDWIEGKQRCIWIHGIPGAGKTVLASHLIEHIREHCKTMTTKKCGNVYYYCYFGHNQDEAVPLLRWTLHQLCGQAKIIPPCLYQSFQEGEEPRLVDLLRALEAVLDAFDHVYIVIDAVDESMPRENLLRVLRDLGTDSRFQKIQLLATSRRYLDIENEMQEISSNVSMSNPLVDEDIRLYVRAKVDSNTKLKHWPSNLRDEVVEALSSGAKGM
jgi:hypothetical protein